MAVPYILKEYCTPELPDDHLVVAIGDDKSDEDIFAALPVRSLRGCLGASPRLGRIVAAGPCRLGTRSRSTWGRNRRRRTTGSRMCPRHWRFWIRSYRDSTGPVWPLHLRASRQEWSKTYLTVQSSSRSYFRRSLPGRGSVRLLVHAPVVAPCDRGLELERPAGPLGGSVCVHVRAPWPWASPGGA